MLREKPWDELSGPVVGIALVLASVFVPNRFQSRASLAGCINNLPSPIAILRDAFRLHALTLSPALSALLLRPKKQTRGPLGKFFGYFKPLFLSAPRTALYDCRAT